MTQTATELNYDIVIVGGGLSGATLALALCHTFGDAISIAVIEPQLAKSVDHSSFDGRALALSQGSVQLLKRWQLWPALSELAGDIQVIEVSDSHHLGYCQMTAEQQQVPALGYVVHAHTLGDALSQKLHHLAAAKPAYRLDVFCPDELQTLKQHQDHVDLTLTSGKTLQAKLLVGADGAKSRVRQQLNIAQTATQYGQVAISCNVLTQLADHSSSSKATRVTAFERFTSQGPLAMLPMPYSQDSQFAQYGLVWCQHASRTQELMALSDTEFAQALQQAFGWRAGKIYQVSARSAYPLTRLIAEQVYQHRCLLIANSAHLIHPIAGQGLNLGIRDIEQMCIALARALDTKQDLGCYRTWSDYCQQRKLDTEKVATATDVLVRVFSNDDFVFSGVRNKGLWLMDRVTPLKNKLAQHAMGLKA
ncbi:2-octaprenyl-6-methoxyphenyl hydroxylase [Saccharobesus litoralis]|uniref:2-octaprenyl-6-methoxyphenyl hydroxylase n=1 Tax=Saccharobesus litoralis TaxID=2172099 RepID=A0A2S0VVY9_9ALTE|nr:2-octaprenyl-6-methoxyphenyl hydroxylase [Saccharobesus litoralis]AWB68387.1 2-octaprenyl-6-methoxyphenyl hydroxylase [Saccharobesus litoralis]